MVICHAPSIYCRALDKEEYLVIIREHFEQICSKTYVVVPYQNRLKETIQMRSQHMVEMRNRKLSFSYHQILLLLLYTNHLHVYLD